MSVTVVPTLPSTAIISTGCPGIQVYSSRPYPRHSQPPRTAVPAVHRAPTHYKQEHYIAFYARELSISPSYLSRIIRKTTGKTAAYFITGLLHAEACRLLLHTDLPIQAIADELNFSDQSAFGKFFKANAGVSPQLYRT